MCSLGRSDFLCRYKNAFTELRHDPICQAVWELLRNIRGKFGNTNISVKRKLGSGGVFYGEAGAECRQTIFKRLDMARYFFLGIIRGACCGWASVSVSKRHMGFSPIDTLATSNLFVVYQIFFLQSCFMLMFTYY